MRQSAVSLCIVMSLIIPGLGTATAGAQGLCPGQFCDNPTSATCDAGGNRITLTGFTPAPSSDSGFASYTYQVCSPPAGTCSLDPSLPCLDHNDCVQNGGTCNRQCAVDSFLSLSHFDIGLPLLGNSDTTCLSGDTQVTGSCTSASSLSVFSVGLDASCDTFGAKCDNVDLGPGECLEMTINIAGELNAPGLGAAVAASKESTFCDQNCISGPSCEPCAGVADGERCLTRTRGFWGSHPHLIQSGDPRSLDLLPIMVCGDNLTVVDADFCSTSEALCTSAKDLPGNPTHLSLVAELTAAKLNLAATAAIGDGACSGWMYDGMGIDEWIAYCEENYCGARKQAIGASGCIEALDNFNNSQDIGFDQTPVPFDRPGPALVGECQLARGNRIWIGGGCPQP